MENFTIREVLEQAVQTEKLGYQYYTAMADRFKEDQKLVKLFSTLAAKELRHEKTYSELKEMVGDEEPEKWDEISPYLRAIVESQFFLGKDKAIPSMDRIRTINDAVDYALGFEKETLLYFFGIRDAVREKEIVDEIINEEKSHIMWLNIFKDALVKR
ncbi:MAG: ferritin family protein [Nitrospirae bacterium]|nr:ferritin family protein [Nitrospirota bacterium]